MSKLKGILAMATMIAAMTEMGQNGNRGYNEPTESDEERKERLAKAEIEQNKANGLKEFKYGGNSLWALNQKSADKKAKKRNWI